MFSVSYISTKSRDMYLGDAKVCTVTIKTVETSRAQQVSGNERTEKHIKLPTESESDMHREAWFDGYPP